MNLFKKSLLSPAVALLLYSSAIADDLTYSIEKQSLKDAIETISKKSNTPYIANSSLLDGKTSNTIKNIKGTKNALDKILENSDLEAIIEDGAIIIKKKVVVESGTILEEISVNEGIYKSGNVENGYLVEETKNIGPWRGKSLQDTPYAVNVMSKDLIENVQATSIDQIYIINPTVQLSQPQSAWGSSTPTLRGFTTYATVFDGIKREKWQYAYDSNPEEYERIETITGLSGFLYGGGNIGGVINYIPKRPTVIAQRSITVGNTGGDEYYTYADLSGPIDEKGKFGYRLNVLSQDGNTFVDNQNHKRNLVNFAFDWHATDSLLIRFLTSHNEDSLQGKQAYWYLDDGVTRPSASSIDATKLWGQKWGINENETTKYSANLEWNISESANFRTAILKELTERSQFHSLNTIKEDGTYEQKTSDYGEDYSEIYGYGGYVYFDFKLDILDIEHELTTGLQVSDSYWDNFLREPYEVNLSNLTFDSPTYVSKPEGGTSLGVNEDIWHTHTSNYTIGDSIEFNPKWSMLVGASYITIKYRDNGYEESAVTPSISLVYKPVENLSLYTSYMEGFEEGGVAEDEYGGYAVVNAGNMMKPLESEQIEIGVKLSLGDTLLTAALFEINKGLEYYDLTDVTKPKFVQDGRQVHNGIELTATGKITDKVTTVAGVTFLNPQVKENKENPLLEGKQPTDVSDRFAKFYLEYSPIESMELAFNAGVNYTGSFYGDAMNTDKLPSYTLANIGTRYTTKQIIEYPLTFRLNVNNLMDKEYWINSNYLGDGRTIHASVEMKF